MSSEEQGGGGGALALPADLAAGGVPHIDQVNVTRNSRLHIGPKFVSVTQNVHRDRVVKGRVLGLIVETRGGVGAGGGDARRLRCSVAVFVCWALVVTAALAAYVGRVMLAARPHRIDLGINATWFMRRGDWQAMPEYAVTFQSEPARFALVGHTATAPCGDRYSCTRSALEIQRDHQRRGWSDIGPNYLVGGAGDEGLVLEGRGAGVIGAMVKSWNERSVSLMWVGNYQRGRQAPTTAQLHHVRELLSALVAAGVLHPQYTLLGHCQVVPWIYTPGVRLLMRLNELDHWEPRNVTACLEWRSRNDTATLADDAATNLTDNATTTLADDATTTFADDATTTLADDATTSHAAHDTATTLADDAATTPADDTATTPIDDASKSLVEGAVGPATEGRFPISCVVRVAEAGVWRVACEWARATSRGERLACAAVLAALVLCAAAAGVLAAPRAPEPGPDPAPHQWNITRAMWLAGPHSGREESWPPSFLPLRLVVVQHTVGPECTRFADCAALMRNLQDYYYSEHGYDLPYNFVVGNEARVYEGRGWELVGAHTRGYNRCALGLAFTGNYRNETGGAVPTAAQLERARGLLAEGVRAGWVHARHVVLGARDVRNSDSPGDALYAALRRWPEAPAVPDHFRARSCDHIYAELSALDAPSPSVPPVSAL